MGKHGHFTHLTNLISRFIGVLPRSIIKSIYALNKNSPTYIGLGLRYVCLKNLAKKCGDNVAIFPNTVIKHPENLSLGDNVSIHSYCYVDAIGDISIGDNVSIANHCSLISFGHTWDNPKEPIKYNKLIMTPIEIHSDVWIGCGVRIIGECMIESRSIIAAGAVVKGNFTGNAIYGGVPAKTLKKI